MSQIPSQPSDPVPQSRQLSALRNALQEKRSEDAVRLIMEGVTQHHVPGNQPLLEWLVVNLGKRLAGRAVDAFADHPCFYCKGGSEVCRDCQGTGRTAAQDICPDCLGLCRIPWGFCNGSGWITLNYVPAGVRIPVALDRVERTVAPLVKLLESPLPSDLAPDSATAEEQCAALILGLNRARCVFENALLVIGSPTGRGNLDAGAEKIRRICTKAAPRAERRMRQAFARMAMLAQRRLDRAREAKAQKMAQAQVRFFHKMALGPWKDTLLAHPGLTT